MRVDIKCTTCDETMGTLEKPEITDTDVSLYQQMMTCPNGHSGATAFEESAPEEPSEEAPPSG